MRFNILFLKITCNYAIRVFRFFILAFNSRRSQFIVPNSLILGSFDSESSTTQLFWKNPILELDGTVLI